MMMLAVEKGSSRLRRRAWYAALRTDSKGFHLVLESYAEQERPTARHNWRNLNTWGRLAYSGPWRSSKQPCPPVPEEVAQSFRDQLIAVISKLEPKDFW